MDRNRNGKEGNGLCAYELTMSPKQLDVVSRACELYARLSIGQFGEIRYEFMQDCSDAEKMERFDRLLMQARAIVFPDLGEDRGRSYGVGRHDPVCERGTMAFDVYQVLRHARAWHDHPEGGMTVNFDEPMQLSLEPLPSCRVIEQEERT